LLEPQIHNSGRNNNGHITIRHKGGRVVEEGDPGDRCIVGWISAVSESDADEVRKQCAAALSQLP
jgi:hypothetical protein